MCPPGARHHYSTIGGGVEGDEAAVRVGVSGIGHEPDHVLVQVDIVLHLPCLLVLHELGWRRGGGLAWATAAEVASARGAMGRDRRAGVAGGGCSSSTWRRRTHGAAAAEAGGGGCGTVAEGEAAVRSSSGGAGSGSSRRGNDDWRRHPWPPTLRHCATRKAGGEGGGACEEARRGGFARWIRRVGREEEEEVCLGVPRWEKRRLGRMERRKMRNITCRPTDWAKRSEGQN